jgi:hypothetical protein
MSDLVEFLRARLDEDEQVARPSLGAERWSPEAINMYAPGLGAGTLAHIARHDPARVLREVEAKRQLIAHLIEFMEGDYAPWNEDALKIIALPYADHPSYREEWRVA